MLLQAYNRGILQNQKLESIVKRMQAISDKIEKRVVEVDADIISTRKDPEVVKNWDKLCLLHMEGLSFLRKCDDPDPRLKAYMLNHQTCINFLHLTEEQTCCSLLFGKK